MLRTRCFGLSSKSFSSRYTTNATKFFTTPSPFYHSGKVVDRFASSSLLIGRSARSFSSQSFGFSKNQRHSGDNGKRRYHKLAGTQYLALSAAVAAPIVLSQSNSFNNTLNGHDILDYEPAMFLNQDPSLTFSTRSILNLTKSLFVFKMCQFESLVDASPYLIDIAKHVNLSGPMFWAIRKTFFEEFCGGETSTDVVPLMARLRESNIRSILDLSVESDIGADGNPVSEKQRILNVLELVRDCIQTASHQSGTFVAVKVTALGSSYSLRVVSSVLSYVRDLYRYHQDSDGLLDYDGFSEIISSMPGSNGLFTFHIEDMFESADSNGNGRINWNEFNRVAGLGKSPDLYVGQIHSSELINSGLFSVSEKYLPYTSAHDINEVRQTSNRLSALCRFAVDNDVKLMFDAEQTHFQAAIDHVAVEMMQKYNRIAGQEEPRAHIYNTYQMYLKDSVDRLKSDHELSITSEEKFVFAAKIVRGAYMNSERERSTVLGTRDPVHETIEDTHDSYDSATMYLLSEGTNRKPVALCIASHNRLSVAKACAYLQENTRDDASVDISFAQLYGMHDHTTVTLANNGWKVFKYLPYGPVEDVIPYLLRRAQENKSILAASGSVLNDSNLLWSELMRRAMLG